jgi:hypothetical protein
MLQASVIGSAAGRGGSPNRLRAIGSIAPTFFVGAVSDRRFTRVKSGTPRR